jgi:hypothetical protein
MFLMKVQVKTICGSDLNELEKNINEFLSGLNPDQLTQIHPLQDDKCWAVLIKYTV